MFFISHLYICINMPYRYSLMNVLCKYNPFFLHVISQPWLLDSVCIIGITLCARLRNCLSQWEAVSLSTKLNKFRILIYIHIQIQIFLPLFCMAILLYWSLVIYDWSHNSYTIISFTWFDTYKLFCSNATLVKFPGWGCLYSYLYTCI